MKSFFASNILASCLLLAFIAGCADEQGISPVAPQGDAQTLGMFSRQLPSDMTEQTLQTLARDAHRRENRFIEAVQPGFLFRSTRIGQSDIEQGRYSYGQLFEIGAQLFHIPFTKEAGFGAKDLPPLSRFHTKRRGGPDARSCSSCHWRGGPAGAGDGADNAYLDGDGDSQSSALARNPIALTGDGIIELLAREMTDDLSKIRSDLMAQAASQGANVRKELISKGISFGFLTAKPGGELDLSEIEGIDTDLVVRPFGWKGNIKTLRDAVEDALLIHHGMQSDHLVETASSDRIGSFPKPDPDGDGVEHEITEGQVTALTLFVAMQEVPQMKLPEGSEFMLWWSEGRERFEQLGCDRCHRTALPLKSTKYELSSRTGGPSVTVDLAKEGAEPRLQTDTESGAYLAYVFTDLKRHDVGPLLMENRPDRGVAREQFLTRPLWGSARSRPYMHDARAPTIEDAILLHAGDAQKERDAYAALPELQRAPLRVYLMSLTRARRMVSP